MSSDKMRTCEKTLFVPGNADLRCQLPPGHDKASEANYFKATPCSFLIPHCPKCGHALISQAPAPGAPPAAEPGNVIIPAAPRT